MIFDPIKALCQVLLEAGSVRERREKQVKRRLEQVLISAFNTIPHYRNMMGEVGYDPNTDYQGVGDLAKFPLLSRQELIAIGDEVIRNNDKSNNFFYIEKTSGSTGVPIRVCRNSYERSVQIVKWMRVLFVNGYRPHQKLMAFCHPQRLVDKKNIVQKFGLFRRKTVNYFLPMSQLTDALFECRPQVLYGNRCHLELVAMDMKKRGLECDFVKLLVVGGEIVHEHSRRLLSEQYGIEAVEYYGSVETGIMAYEISGHKGLHLCEDQMVFEILDDTGHSVQPGVEGQLVVSDLSMKSMPLIRYSIGDRVIWDEYQTGMGKSERRLKEIVGRDDDYALMPDGSLRPHTDVLETMSSIAGIDQFRVTQKTINYFLVEIAMEKDRFDQIKESVAENLAAVFKFSPKVDVRHVECILPEANGKIRKLISEVFSSHLHCKYGKEP